MQVITALHSDGTVFTAELDEYNVAYSTELRAIDLLWAAPFCATNHDTENIKAIKQLMAVIILLPTSHCELQDRIRRFLKNQYEDLDFKQYSRVEGTSHLSSKAVNGWEGWQYTQPDFRESASHTDGGQLVIIQADPATILLPTLQGNAAHELERYEADILRKEGKINVENLFAHENNLFAASHYWLQAKGRCLAAFRGSHAGESCLHARPMYFKKRKVIVDRICSITNKGIGYDRLVPKILTCQELPIGIRSLKSRSLEREYIPELQLRAA